MSSAAREPSGDEALVCCTLCALSNREYFIYFGIFCDKVGEITVLAAF